jgi:23S rRNA pseudouridine1911/1915/1917 synthase
LPLNDGYVYSEKLGASARGTRTLAYLAGRYRHSSAETWAERVARGEVRLDGAVATGAEVLHAGQQLDWHRPPWDEADAPLDWRVLYEDADLLAVHKPGGLPTLPSGGFLQNTLLYRVQARYPEAVPMHRLGRGTSGLVLFTRTPEAATRLAADWREHRVEKCYRALGQGRAAGERYDITAPIGPVPHPRLGSVHAASPEGKPSQSTARVLERREADTLFEVHIRTGRPDQIRIHLAFVGHPLVGDPLYGPGGLPSGESPALPGDCGYLLHSLSLALTHPLTGARLQLHAPPPPVLEVSPAAA